MANFSLVVVIVVVLGFHHCLAVPTCDEETTKGQCCVFPFRYKGKLYHNCTSADYGNRLWCATTSNYDNDGLWGACYSQGATTCHVKTTKSQCCVFPFRYKKKLYHNCTSVDYGNSLWCATTSNYDNDGLWGACYSHGGSTCEEKTAKGQCCVFPFRYKRKLYHNCTSVDYGNSLWCATTSNYDNDGLWGACYSHGATTCHVKTTKGQCCVFPFRYKRKLYHNCTSVDNGNRLWCATTSNYDNDGLWGACYSKVVTTCEVKTTKGQCCVFPFQYKRKLYQKCTSVDYGNDLWCATTNNYDNDGLWGACDSQGKNGGHA